MILADETCADLLDVKNGDPLFYFHSTGYDESHTAIEYSIAKYRGDRNSFVFNFQITCIILNTFIYKYQFFLYNKAQ